MIGCELFESPDGFSELELGGKIKRWIEQRAVGRDRSLGDGDAVQRRTGADAQSNREIDGVTSDQPPAREVQRLFQRVASLTRTAHEKDPERFDAVTLDALSYLANFGGVESFLQLFEHCIAGAFGGDSEGAEACALHRTQQLG